jgi:biotin carboxyl carrier protein
MTDAPHADPGTLPIALLVAPCAGRLRILPPKSFEGGVEWLEQGQEIARIEKGATGSEPVISPYRGRLGGIMGRDGEPVRAGQPVAWMEAIKDASSLIKPVEGRSA